MAKRTCSRCGQSHYLDCLDLRYEARIDRLTTPDGCHPWTGLPGRGGYGRFSLAGRRSKGIYAHRFGWALLHGPIPPGLYVCHTCDNPPCQNPRHWFLGTSQDNSDDRVAKGRQARGAGNARSKLSPAEVLLIRERYAAGGTTYSSLGRAFGISKVAVGYIVRREHWRDLQ